jgi:hypothetical protein
MLLCKFHRLLGSVFSHVTGIVNTKIKPSGCGVAFADISSLHFTAYDVNGRAACRIYKARALSLVGLGVETANSTMFASRSSVLAWATLVASIPLASAANATFYPKINLTDTSGTLIQAHGGAVLRSASSDDKNWYWFGEDKTGLTNSGR